MRKTIPIVLCGLAAVLAIAGTITGMNLKKSDKEAAREHSYVQQEFSRRLSALQETSFTVTEDGAVVGDYTLEDLGLMQSAERSLRAEYSDTDLLSAEGFGALSILDRINWNKQTHPTPRDWKPAAGELNLQPVLDDLRMDERTAPQNADFYFEDSAYHVVPEVNGNMLDLPVVEAALTDCLSTLVVGSTPQTLSVELTDSPCYLLPEVTVANANFDYKASFAEAVSDATVKITFYDGVDIIRTADFLELTRDGRVELDEASLNIYLERIAEKERAENVLFRFNSYSSGRVEVSDVPGCTYELDKDTLRETLKAQLLSMESGDTEAPYLCSRYGQPFDPLGDTYIEVDLLKQVMTFIENGELLVTTPVVTGMPWDGHNTPSVLIQVNSKENDQWLVGEDYRVFVKYWLGLFDGYGLHDASWRDVFGGERYKSVGSHGCVNTPDEAMAIIFEHAEEGTPVLMFREKPLD